MSAPARSPVTRLPLRAATLGFLLCTCSAATPVRTGDKEKLPMAQTEVWDLVDAIARSLPLRKNAVEALLGATLEPDQEDEERIYYRAAAIQPREGAVRIVAVDLRLRKAPADAGGFLLIELGDSRVTRGEVERRFPGGKVELPRPGPPPQGISPDARIAYSVPQAWGRLTFGFRVRAPDIMESIALQPRASR